MYHKSYTINNYNILTGCNGENTSSLTFGRDGIGDDSNMGPIVLAPKMKLNLKCPVFLFDKFYLSSLKQS